MQVQSIKQANSVLKRSLADGVDAMRPAEVQLDISIQSLSHLRFFYNFTAFKFIMILLVIYFCVIFLWWMEEYSSFFFFSS